MISVELQKFGLSDKEAKVSAALFELGESVVTDVAKRASINRSTAYVLLESLVKQGLVSISEKRGVRVYSPVSPAKLIEIAEANLKKSKDLLDLSKELALRLKENAPTASSKPFVKVYEGSEGFKIISEDKLRAKNLIQSYSSIENIRSAYPNYSRRHENELAATKREIQTIVPDTAGNRRALVETAKGEKYLVADTGYSGELTVYGNTVSFSSPEENISVLFESAQFAKALRTLFDLTITKARRFNIQPQEKNSAVPREKRRALVKVQKRFFTGE